jgi:ubiquinone/menaquinone biosynthesis C-methylase UbiE
MYTFEGWLTMVEVDHKKTYKENAIEYETMIAREDYQGNLLRAMESISSLKAKTVVDLGSGTGRIARLVASRVNRVVALDISLPMLEVARDKLTSQKSMNCITAVADHRQIPLYSQSVDLVISGWSVCYLVDWYRSTWQSELVIAFSEMKRVLKPDGKIILIETQGTGFKEPHPPEHLLQYFKHLGELGFAFRWIRTDYEFADVVEAKDLAGAFFGEEMREKIAIHGWKNLPECTGIWWGTIQELKI